MTKSDKQSNSSTADNNLNGVLLLRKPENSENPKMVFVRGCFSKYKYWRTERAAKK